MRTGDEKMGHTCVCGEKIQSEKKVHKVTLELNNPGIVQIDAPAAKCDECGKYHFSESDAKEIFGAFDKQIAKKSKH